MLFEDRFLFAFIRDIEISEGKILSRIYATFNFKNTCTKWALINNFLLTSNDIVLKKKKKLYTWNKINSFGIRKKKKKFISVRTRSRVFDKASSYFIRIKISDIKLDSSQLENRTFILKRICFESKRWKLILFFQSVYLSINLSVTRLSNYIYAKRTTSTTLIISSNYIFTSFSRKQCDWNNYWVK